MSSKQAILDSLRSRRVEPTPLPSALPFEPVQYAAVVEQFQQSLKTVGGKYVEASPDKLVESIRELDVWKEAKHIYAHGRAAELSTETAEELNQVQTAALLDLAIADGAIGVAENGAIWIAENAIVARSSLFLTQHLILCITASQIAHNMHEAYAQIDSCREPYGVFVSGPSKTADIEQSLVLGAHGPRTLTVMLIDG